MAKDLNLSIEYIVPDVVEVHEVTFGLVPMIHVEMGREDDGTPDFHITIAGVEQENAKDFVDVVGALLNAVEITGFEEADRD